MNENNFEPKYCQFHLKNTTIPIQSNINQIPNQDLYIKEDGILFHFGTGTIFISKKNHFDSTFLPFLNQFQNMNGSKSKKYKCQETNTVDINESEITLYSELLSEQAILFSYSNSNDNHNNNEKWIIQGQGIFYLIKSNLDNFFIRFEKIPLQQDLLLYEIPSNFSISILSESYIKFIANDILDPQKLAIYLVRFKNSSIPNHLISLLGSKIKNNNQ